MLNPGHGAPPRLRNSSLQAPVNLLTAVIVCDSALDNFSKRNRSFGHNGRPAAGLLMATIPL